VLAALGGGVALAAKDDTLLVSERGGVAANGNSRSVSVSANVGRVAFTSAADTSATPARPLTTRVAFRILRR